MNEALLEHGAVVEYLNQVCRQIKAKEVHRDIRMELLSHLSEHVEDKMSEGLSQEVAIQQALKQVGDPIQIGNQFHDVHKPVLEWRLAGIVAILVGLGIMSMYAMKFAVPQDFRDIFLPNQLYFAVLGIVAMVIIYLFDYRKLQKYSWGFYGLAVGLMVLCKRYGLWVNGKKTYLDLLGFPLNVYEFLPYIFILAFAGLIANSLKKEHVMQVGNWLMILLYFIIPGYFYLTASSIDGFIIHCVGIIVIHIVMTRQVKLLLGSLAAFVTMIGLAALLTNHDKMYMIFTRLSSWLNPMQDPSGSGYMYLTISKVLRSAGMWGQGFGVQMKLLPYIYNDMIVPYLIYSLGWCFGLLLIIMICILIRHTVRISIDLTDPFGRSLIIGLSTIVSFKFIYSMLMSVGLLPITSIAMPLISYGGIALILNLTVIGIMLSVYRRKNMFSQIAE